MHLLIQACDNKSNLFPISAGGWNSAALVADVGLASPIISKDTVFILRLKQIPMSSTQSTAKRLRSPLAPGDSAGYHRFIDQQVEKTGTQVKLVDLGSSLMVLGAGVLSYLLVMTIIDHWFFSLGPPGRWAALVLLVSGAGWYMARVVLPVAFGRVNPLFAAQAIEHSEPSLKNSLLNFLLFRSDRAGVRAAVYQALEQRAAADLKHVPIDTAVDRSRLIKLGCFLAGVLVICAAYTMLASKSPFQSVARVLVPWADIERPSRVRIEEVQPGHIEVFQGERTVVSAHLYDLRRDEPVTLHYAGLDAQQARQSAAMQPGAGSLRYESPLPPEDDGFQRDVTYWIEAGDARSAAYRVRVIPAPVMLIESIEYDYPHYTKLPQRIVQRQGDVRAVEGTRITVRARANQPIAAAVLEFDPPADVAGQTPDRGLQRGPLVTAPYRIEMEFRGQEAWCSFVCEMNEPRTGARHRTYQLRFATESGHRNPQPVLHRIEVLADLPPEIEILTPAADRVEVPEDGWQKIEIRAVDPDYGLTAIRLEATAGGRQVLLRDLLQDPAGRSGQEMTGFEFAPRALGMRAGTEAQCGAVAEDNRAAPLTGLPEPNIAKSRQITLVITPAENAQPPAAGQENPDPERPEQGTAPQQPGEMAKDPAGDQQAGGDQSADGQQADGNQQGGEAGQASQSDGASGQAGSSAGQGGTDSSQSGGDMQSQGGSGSVDGADGSQDGTGSASGQRGSSGTQGVGTGDTSAGGEAGGTEAGRAGESPGSDGGEAQPSEPLHDGEAFEKAMEHIQQAGDGQGQKGASQNEPSPDETSQSGAESQTADQGGRSSAGSRAADASPQGTSSGDGRPSDAPGGDQTQPAPSSGKTDGHGEQPSPDGGQGPGGQKQETPQPGESAQEPGDQQGGMEQKPSGSAQPKEAGQNEGAQSGSGQRNENRGGSVGGQDPDGTSQKKASSNGAEPRPSDEPQSPSISRKASDSQGDAGGDQSGGAKQGGGQSGQQAGNDSPGGTTPGDQGAGAAQESGTGEIASRPGDKQPSPEPTGKPGHDAGDGSRSMPASDGAGGSGAPPKQSPGQASGTPRAPSGETSSESGQGMPRGGGEPGSGEFEGGDAVGEVPPGEQPNLDYARKATDMVLEHLKDQESHPDEDLLNKLGWTKEDLQDFVRRWSELKRAATEDPRAKQDLDDALRSLGLRPATAAPRRTEMQQDARRTERNLGARSNPPPSYRDLFDAYRKGTGRVGERPDSAR